jgi:hypothetical protein
MATLTVIWWRDIPAQVLARDGRRASKVVLHPRFQVAIDKAASRAGKRAYNDYIEEWRKVARACGDDLEAEVSAESERLEAEYDKHRLAELIQSGGVAGGPALPPAHDETPKGARDGSPNGDANGTSHGTDKADRSTDAGTPAGTEDRA